MVKTRHMFFVSIILFSFFGELRSAELESRFYSAREVLITTDMEPDDVLALYMMFQAWSKSGKQPETIIFLVGERENVLKEALVKEFLNALPFKLDSKIQVLLGESTDLAHPMKHLLTAFPKLEKSYAKAEPQIGELAKLLIQVRPELIISLKPDREFLISSVIDLDLSYAQFWHYGSFNDRVLINEFPDNHHFQEAMLKHYGRFGEAIIIESYHTIGSDNSLNPDISQGFFSQLSSSKTFFSRFWKLLMLNWNEGILVEVVNGVVEDAVKGKNDFLIENYIKATSHFESLSRSLKIYDKLIHHINEQVVIGDPLVAAFLTTKDKKFSRDNLRSVSLEYNKYGYTVFTSSDLSNIWTSFGTDKEKETRLAWILEIFDSLQL